MHGQIGQAVQEYSDKVGREVTGREVHQIFLDEFVSPPGPYELIGYWPHPDEKDPTHIHGRIKVNISGQRKEITTEGNGPISAFVAGLKELGASGFTIDDYEEQAIGKGADATAVAYVPLRLAVDGIVYGVGMDTNIDQAAVRAIVAGLNRLSRTTK